MLIVDTSIWMILILIQLEIIKSVNTTVTDANTTVAGNFGYLQPFFDFGSNFLDSLGGEIPVNAINSVLDGELNNKTLTEIYEFLKPLITSQTRLFVCLIFGFILAIFLPVTGCILCCCRCCNKCGGRRYQDEKKPRDFRCGMMTALLFGCFIMMLAGLGLYGETSRQFYKSLDNLPSRLDHQLTKVNDHLLEVPEKLNKIINKSVDSSFADIKVEMDKSFKEIRSDLEIYLNKFNDSLQNHLGNASILIRRLGMDLDNVVKNLQILNEKLQSTTIDELTKNINNMKLKLDKAIPLQKNVNSLNIDEVMKEAKKKIDFEIRKQQNAIGSSLSLTNTKKRISDFQNSANTTLSTISKHTKVFLAKAKKVTGKQYLLIIAVLPLILICFCLFSGLVCGIFGYKRVHPTNRSVVSDCGGKCLLSSVGLVFISGTYLVLLSTVFFVAAFFLNILCGVVFEDKNPELWETIDEVMRNRGFEFPLGKAINQCKGGKSLITIFNLTSTIDAEISKAQKETEKVLIAVDLSGLIDPKNLDFHFDANITDWKTTIEQIQMNNQKIINLLNQTQNVTELLTSLDSANLTASQLISQINNLQSEIRSSEASIKSKILLRIRSTKLPLSKIILTSFQSFNRSIYDLASCQPFYESFLMGGNIICKQVGSPLNGLWLGVGCCIFFFIPMIILGVLLSKYLLTMDPLYYSTSRETLWDSLDSDFELYRPKRINAITRHDRIMPMSTVPGTINYAYSE